MAERLWSELPTVWIVLSAIGGTTFLAAVTGRWWSPLLLGLGFGAWIVYRQGDIYDSRLLVILPVSMIGAGWCWILTHTEEGPVLSSVHRWVLGSVTALCLVTGGLLTAGLLVWQVLF
jgi:hypothetical protein